MALSVGIDLGPSSGADSGVYLEGPAGDRLFLVSRRSGCLSVMGLGVVSAGAVAQAAVLGGHFSWWQPIVGLALGLLGGYLLFGRRWLRLDRKRRLMESGLMILRPLGGERRLLGPYTRVVIRQEDSSHTDSDGHTTVTTTFPTTLEGGDGVNPVSLTTAGIWENAVPVAEAVARFLHIPLIDEAVEQTRDPEELDHSLRDRADRPTDKKDRRRPAHRAHRIEVEEHSDRLLRASIPRPEARPWLAILAVIVLFWCLPVGFLSRSAFHTLLPLVVVGATAIKCVLGFRSRIHVTPESLEVKTYGLVFRRTAVFPSEELEQLPVRPFESGGPRTALAHMMDGVLIARSDQESIRFGHGLTTGELKWLRHEIHRIITTPVDDDWESEGAPNRPSQQVRWTLVWVGWIAGTLAAATTGGFLAMGVAAPFLEHVLNVGGLAGGLAALLVLSVRRERARDAAIQLVPLLIIGVLVLDLLGGLQLRPSYQEMELLRSSSPPGRFWFGWIPIMAVLDLLLAEGLQWAIHFVRQMRRRRDS